MLTQSGTVMGSPGFMSPEQAEGRAVGKSSDVFSLGAVLTFAATGQGPFGAGPTPALISLVRPATWNGVRFRVGTGPSSNGRWSAPQHLTAPALVSAQAYS